MKGPDFNLISILIFIFQFIGISLLLSKHPIRVLTPFGFL